MAQAFTLRVAPHAESPAPTGFFRDIAMISLARGTALGLLLLAPLASAGCKRPPTYGEVQGTVTLNGKPLDAVMVQFLPDPQKGTKGARSTGMTDAEGHYTLTCDDQHEGAVVGHHLVYVWDLQTVQTKYEREHEMEIKNNPKLAPKKPIRPIKIPTKYAPGSKTPMHLEVKPGEQTIDLVLKAP
jgi:hypothetical protein